jgi:hypothetical protein
MAKFASGMDFGVVLKIVFGLHDVLAFWSGIPIQGRSRGFPESALSHILKTLDAKQTQQSGSPEALRDK